MKVPLRNTFGKYLARVLIGMGLVKKAVQKAQNGEYILPLCFHAPGRELFESCIQWLDQNGFHFISVCELDDIIQNAKPFPKGAVLITIDDGWQSNHENILPVAIQYKVPVKIFVSTEMVEKGNAYWWSYINAARKEGIAKASVEFFKTIDNEDRIKILEEAKSKIHLNREALTIDQVKEIAQSNFVSIGSHSVTHPILPRCNNEQSKFEIRESKTVLESWTGKPINHFAYPNGDFSNREVSLLRRYGYTLAFSTQQQYLTQKALEKPYDLPRFMMVEGASFEENICRMVGVWPLKPKKKAIVYP